MSTWGAYVLINLHNEVLVQCTAAYIVVHKRMLMLHREEPSLGEVVYPRGSISGLPEAHASRKERFMELDDLQPGWEVELRGRKGGTTVDATFYSPTGNDTNANPAHGTYVCPIRCKHKTMMLVYAELPADMCEHLARLSCYRRTSTSAHRAQLFGYL